MAKYLIKTAELTRKVYVIDAYSEEEAVNRRFAQAPHDVRVLSETTYEVECINEYQYVKEWKSKEAIDMRDLDLQAPLRSADFLIRKDHEGYQYDWVRDESHFD